MLDQIIQAFVTNGLYDISKVAVIFLINYLITRFS
jgi:hypothetical protein